jgi:twitching motility protein PilT
MDLTINELLKTVVENGCSDLHIISETEPRLRIDGELELLDIPPLNTDQVKSLLYSIIDSSQKKVFEETNELDFAILLSNIGRFRANYYMERKRMAAAFRIIPEEIPSLDELNQPHVLYEFSNYEKGLILVTGPTGSGKSTTMASIINEINENHKKHIITIEDPIEFEHTNKKSVFSQREVGEDTASFASALKYAMREDPDVILVGEMRDLETIRAALTAAETGHLVIGTLHTNSAVQTINRIINVFPREEQDIIRTQLSMTLKGIVSQILVPKIEGGRIAIQEILTNVPAVANLIRENKLPQLKSQMELNQTVTLMQTQKQELLKFINMGEISKETALKYASDRAELEKNL